MRIFLIMDGNGREMAALVAALKQQGHEVLYWVGLENAEVKKFPSVIFHRHSDARTGIPPPGLEVFDFPPPGEELLQKLYRAESRVAFMARRQWRKIGPLELRHKYYCLLRYWHGVIAKFRPELIIFPVMPHNIYDYLIYELAKLLNVKTLSFEDTWVANRALVYRDFWDGSEKLRLEIARNQGKTFSVSDLHPDLQAYYHRQTDKSQDTTPVYMKHDIPRGWKRMEQKAGALVKILRAGTFFPFLRRRLASFWSGNLAKEYKGLQAAPDFSQNYVYVPLSFQPERTTSAQGGVFADLLLMLEILSAALPDGWKIYVKEHPNQWRRDGVDYSNVRYKGYYGEIASLKNVTLIPVDTDTYRLMERAQAVATATGTAGWEALIRLKPVLIFGYPWYRDCPAALRVNDLETCRNALEKIKNGYSVSRQEIINYLVALDRVTFECYVDNFEKETPGEINPRWVENFINAVANEIREISLIKN